MSGIMQTGHRPTDAAGNRSATKRLSFRITGWV
jgi:hypothetical protein